jgi:hypothetical protein
MDRVPELESTSEARESPETVEEEPERAEPCSSAGESQESEQRPWWRRVFGGEREGVVLACLVKIRLNFSKVFLSPPLQGA